MGEKKNNNNGDGGEKKNKDDNPITVVLKIDMHCEGCASKIVKTVRGFDGVDAARAEFEANKLTAVGKVDPAKLRESLAEKMRKKVDLISPQPKKTDGNDGNNAKNDKKKADGNDNKKTPDDNKPKEKQLPVTTAVFKLRLHCQGCIAKMHKTVIKTKGFNDMSIDKQKELVTVIGAMDMKALAETLSGKLKRPVEIVPPKKEKDGEKAENNGGGSGGGGGKKKGGGGGGGGDGGGQKGDGGDAGGGKMEESRMEYLGQPVYGFGVGFGPGVGYGYPPGYAGEYLHPPQLFSDENPNACSIM